MKKIKEIQEYFKNKLISGDYEILYADHYRIHVIIDSKYVFVLWIANGESHLKIDYDYKFTKDVISFMDIGFTAAERKKIWSNRIRVIAEKQAKEKADAELKEYHRLKKKFGDE